MSDAYEILGVEPRPWIDPETVKSAFRQKASAVHPDGREGVKGDFERFHKARASLLDSASALALLARRLGDERPLSSQPPTEAFDRFAKVSEAVSHCRQALTTVKESRSRMSRVLAQKAVISALTNARGVRSDLEHWRSELDEIRLKLDRQWPEVTPEALRDLALRYRYVDRWLSELGEWVFVLETEAG